MYSMNLTDWPNTEKPEAKRRIWAKAVFAFVIVFAAFYMGTIVLLGLKANANNAWQENMLSHGPWASQAIWASEDYGIYLSSEKSLDEQLATCVAYITTDSGVITCIPELHYGSKVLDFCDGSGKLLFSCKVDLIGEGQLKLYDIDYIAAVMAGSKLQSVKVIYLTKMLQP